MLVKLTPTWQTWASRHLIELHRNDQSDSDIDNSENNLRDTQLVSVDRGKLIVACANSACASRIKHLQQNLLETLQSQGFSEIEQIVVRIQHNLNNDLNHAEKGIEKTQLASTTKTRNRVTSSNSLKAIQYCQKTVANDQLANALKKLSETLKKTNN